MKSRKEEIRQTITFKEKLYNAATQKADLLGLSVTDYFRYLVVKDTEGILNVPYLSPDQEVELEEAEKEVSQGKSRRINSVDEYIKSLS